MIAVVLLANVLGALMALPQAHRIWRTRRVSGVSPEWAMMSLSINCWWAIYGIGVHEWALIPVSAVSAAGYAFIAYSMLRHSPASTHRVVGRLARGAIVALAPLPFLIIGDWAVTGLALGALYGIQLSPAVLEVYRSTDVSGVSAATWGLAWVEAALWGIYGLPRADLGLVALAVTGLVASTLVLARLFVKGGRRVSGTELAPLLA